MLINKYSRIPKERLQFNNFILINFNLMINILTEISFKKWLRPKI